MTTDTITIPAEIPREIRDGDKVLKVVGMKISRPLQGEFYWRSTVWHQSCGIPNEKFLAIVAITEPVPRYIYPTPVEACRMIADAGGPIECEFSDDDFKNEGNILKGRKFSGGSLASPSDDRESFARQCFGNFFTRGKWAKEVLPTEEIEAAIGCILKSDAPMPITLHENGAIERMDEPGEIPPTRRQGDEIPND